MQTNNNNNKRGGVELTAENCKVAVVFYCEQSFLVKWVSGSFIVLLVGNIFRLIWLKFD